MGQARYVLGADCGASKTLTVLADEAGYILGMGRAEGANFGIVGVAAAQEEIALSIAKAVAMAGIDIKGIGAAFYGVAQADRPEDFAVIAEFLEPINPAPRLCFDNDSIIVLKLGAIDCVGIALISGTGSNAVGVNAKGERHHIGAVSFGDRCSGSFIADSALAAGMRASDGRGLATQLREEILKFFGVRSFADLAAKAYHDSRENFNKLRIVGLVFEVASAGDEIAVGIVRDVLDGLCLRVEILLDRLFCPGEMVPVVVGGGTFRAGGEMLITELRKSLKVCCPNAKLIVSDLEPVFGSLFYAFEEMGVMVTSDLIGRLSRSFRDLRGRESREVDIREQ